MSVFTPEVQITNTPLPVDTTGQTINVGNFPATQNVAITSSVELEIKNDSGNPIPVTFTGTATGTATVTNVSVGTSPTTLSASNASKTRVAVYNETGTLFVKCGSGASSTSYSYRLTANTSLEIDGYYGIVTATKATGTTSVLVTEFGI